MKIRSTARRYGGVARGLHWVSVLLILVLVGLGLVMTRVDEGDNTTMYRVHVAIGLLVAALTIVRAVWRFLEPTPTPPPMPRWRRWIFVANHYALYVGLFALAATGIATLVANDLSPFPPDVVASQVDDVAAGDAHLALGLIYVGLCVMHIGGVLSYQRTKGDVLNKMGINIKSPVETEALR